MSILDKLEQIDRRILYTLFIIFVSIPILYPFSIPVNVGEKVRTFYNIVENLPEGSLVVFNEGTTVGGYPGLRSPNVAVVAHLFLKNMKVVFFTGYLEGSIIYDTLLEEIDDIIENKEYGVDYAFLGYIAGEETALAQVAADPKKAFPTDYTGTPWDDLPILENWNDASDIDLLIVATSGTVAYEGSIRQFTAAYGTPMAMIMFDSMAPSAEPYYPEQAKGLIYGPTLGAQYELLIKRPATGSSQLGVQSAVHIMMIIVLSIGNILFWIKKRRGET